MTRPVPYPFPPLVPADPEAIAARMADVLGRTWEAVQQRRRAVVASAVLLRRDETLAALDELADSTAAFQSVVRTEAERFARLDVPAQYARGAMRAATSAEPFSWTQFHTEAAQSLAADSYDDFLRRSEEAGRTSAAFARSVRAVARDRTAFSVTNRQTALDTARDLEARLALRGITVATYADGSTRTMRVYTEMAVRTKTAVAYNTGTLNTCAEDGIRYVEVFDGAGCGWTSHDDPTAANGRVTTLADAARHPISHPQCRRAFGPRPDVTTPAEARSPALSTTPDQREDQARSERATPAQIANARRLRPADPVRDRTSERRRSRTTTPAPPAPAPPEAPDLVPPALPVVRPPAVRRARRTTPPPPPPSVPDAPDPFLDRVRRSEALERQRLLNLRNRPPAPAPATPAPPRRETDDEYERRKKRELYERYRTDLVPDELARAAERAAAIARLDAVAATRNAAKAQRSGIDSLPRKPDRGLAGDEVEVATPPKVTVAIRDRRVVTESVARPPRTLDADLYDDLRAANPGYGTDPQFGVNCVHVANTVELRRRGYDVVATPLPRAMGTSGRDSGEVLRRWVTPDGALRTYEKVTKLRLPKVAAAWGPGARGHVIVRWSRGGGHIYNVEVGRDGVPVFYDAQNGTVLADGDYLDRASQVFVARVDDLEPSDLLLDLVSPRGAPLTDPGPKAPTRARAPRRR